MNFAAMAAQAATYVVSRASTLISTAVSSLVSVGLNAPKTINAYVRSRKISIRIQSYSTVIASEIAKKISTFLTTNIAIIKDINPRARVQIKKNTTNTVNTNDVETKGFNEFANSLEELSAQIDSIVSVESTKSIETIRQQMMAYPSPPMNSSYNRTFALRQGWEVADISFSLNTNIENTGKINAPFGERATTVSLSNAVPYTKWVQQRSTQSAVHKGRWSTIEDVSYQESIELSNRIEEAIQKII
jgi:hypothetical protein